MAIETLFSTGSDARKTHLIIDGVDACATRKNNPLYLWDCGGEVSLMQISLFRQGLDPDNRLCKWCMRKVVTHLTKRAPDLKPACPTCKDTGSIEYPCPNCRSSKVASSG